MKRIAAIAAIGTVLIVLVSLIPTPRKADYAASEIQAITRDRAVGCFSRANPYEVCYTSIPTADSLRWYKVKWLPRTKEFYVESWEDSLAAWNLIGSPIDTVWFYAPFDTVWRIPIPIGDGS